MAATTKKATGEAQLLVTQTRSAIDASGAEMVDITQENGRQTRNLRTGLLTLNYAHNNEIYGSMVVYLRIKNLVPPASEPRPQQKK